MKIGMTFRSLTSIASEGTARGIDVLPTGRKANAAPEAPWNLELIGANFRAWLAGAGEIQILLLLDSVAHELKNRGRLFPTEIPCFGAFGLHRISRIGAGVHGSNGAPSGASRGAGERA